MAATRCRRTTVQCPDCTTFHFLWCLRIASFGAVTIFGFFIPMVTLVELPVMMKVPVLKVVTDKAFFFLVRTFVKVEILVNYYYLI